MTKVYMQWMYVVQWMALNKPKNHKQEWIHNNQQKNNINTLYTIKFGLSIVHTLTVFLVIMRELSNQAFLSLQIYWYKVLVVKPKFGYVVHLRSHVFVCDVLYNRLFWWYVDIWVNYYIENFWWLWSLIQCLKILLIMFSLFWLPL